MPFLSRPDAPDALLSDAINAANNLVVIADMQQEDAPLIYVNDHFLAFTGYTAGEVLGRNCRFLQIRPDGTRDTDQPDLPKLRRALARCEPARVTLHNYKKDGTPFWNELYVSPIRDGTGAVRYFAGVQNDVTRRFQLGQQVLDIQAHERERMARDLHDGLGQILQSINTRAVIARTKMEDAGLADQAAALQRIVDLASDAGRQARALAHGLFPVDVEADGFAAALDRLVATADEMHDAVACTFVCETPIHLADTERATHLYRIAQEALTNALKHAGATTIDVVVSADPHVRDGFVLGIEDDGAGVPLAVLDAQQGGGLGMHTMRHRAEIVGGRLTVARRATGGTVVRCFFHAEPGAPELLMRRDLRRAH
jgi:PAS domain S-box-containing protein